MNEQLRSKILNASPVPTGVKNSAIARLRFQLKDLAKIVPPPDYDRYIRSKVWKIKRQKFLDHYKNQCQLCNSKEHLHVHHLHYQTVGAETTQDVVVCCRRCHFIEHLPHNDDPKWAGTAPAQHIQKPIS